MASLRFQNYKIIRGSPTLWRYATTTHSRDKGNERNKCRYKLLKNATQRMFHEGLNSTQYSLVRIEKDRLFTRILVDLNEHRERMELKSICG